MSITPSLDHWEILIRLSLSVALGGILGADRELRGMAAGLRTHMLVALGAATTTLVGLQLYEMLTAHYDDNRGDPLRVIEGTIAALGFLGAGAIIQSRGEVRGLTTAANLWLCGAIGIACGGGHYVVAGVALVWTALIVSGGVLLERWLNRAAGSTDTAPPKL